MKLSNVRTLSLAGLLLGILGLTACGGPQNTRPPAALQPIKTSLQVHQLWSTHIGDGNGGYFIHLHPYVSGKTLYAADHAGIVAAYSLANGSQIWRMATKHKLVGGVSGGGGMLFVGAQDGKILGISLKSRSIVWKTQLSSEVMSVSEAALGEVLAHTNDGGLYAIDVSTGNILWSHHRQIPNLILRGKNQPLVVGSSTVLSGFSNGKLAAYSLSSGAPLWQVIVGEPSGVGALQQLVDVDGKIAVSASGDTIYAAGYHGRAIAVQSSNGQILWSHPMSSYAGVAANSSAVFVAASNSDIWALDRANGASLWKQDALHYRVVTAPSVVGERYVVVGDYAGYLQWLSASDGRIVAREHVGSGGIQAAPIVVGDSVFVQTAGGTLAAYRIAGENHPNASIQSNSLQFGLP